MRPTVFCVLAIHFAARGACAQQPQAEPTVPSPTSIRAQTESLSKELAIKEKTLAASRAAENDPEKRRLLAAEQLRVCADYARKFLALADRVPGESTALEPLCAAALAEYRGPEVEIALDRLRLHCGANPKIAEYCRPLGQLPSAKLEPLFRAILANNPDRTANGHACLALARLLALRAEFPRYRAGDPAMAKGLEQHYDKSLLDELDRRDVKAMSAEAEALFARVSSEFANVKLLPAEPSDHQTIGPAAETWLAARRELAIGNVAPEIVGSDAAGEPLKLSAYRGEVVVLVFWASWCGPCMEQIPHEVALANRLAGKPFTILGVNLDRTVAAAQAVIKKEGIPWPNWLDGDPAKPGPILTRYHIQAVPEIFVLDRQGIIRARDVHGEALDKNVEILLRENHN